MAFKRYLLAHSALCAPFLLLGLHAAMADDPDTLPAVSSLNGKVEIWGGGSTRGVDILSPVPFSTLNNDFKGGFYARGAVTVPLEHRFGFQADGIVGSVQSHMYVQIGAHVFWRDPSFGLFGLYGSYSTWDGVNAHHLGVETEAYFGRLTLRGLTGFQSGDVDGGLFSISKAVYYVTDNFSASLGHRFDREVGHAVTAALEHQFYRNPTLGISAFAKGSVGEDDYRSVFAGLKFYFGEDKSLIQRHREDDPEIWDFVNTLTGCTDTSLVDSVSKTKSSGPSTKYPITDSIVSSEIGCNGDYMSIYR